MKIEKNTDIPRRKAYTENSKYDSVRSMSVGECIFFEGAKSQREREVDTSRRIMRRKGWSPVVRKCEDGVRIWRTA